MCQKDAVLTLDKNATSNQILNLLGEKKRTHFIGQCDLIDVHLGDVLAEAGDAVQYVYCPTSCVISWETQMVRSTHVLIALIGNEGMLCMNTLLEVEKMPYRAVVRKTGQLLRISNKNFIQQTLQTPALATILKHYIFVSYGDAVQTAACNLFHLLEQRLARLLMMFSDRSHSNELIITQELLSQMLGVRRVGVTKAAGILQSKHLIHYSRGHVTIEDKLGLTHVACSCYQKDIDRYHAIMHKQ